MQRRTRRGKPLDYNVPSQAPSTARPYYPSAGDLRSSISKLQPNPPGQGGSPPVYTLTVFDARPINAADFHTETGSSADDTGQVPGAQTTSSTFFLVPNGYTAVLRKWQALIIPQTGPAADGLAIFGADGGSFFVVKFDVLVDDVSQPGMSNIISRATAFGDVEADCYVIASQGQTIEFRAATVGAGATFNQCLVALSGNLLMSKGLNPQYEPGTSVTLPVHDDGRADVNTAEGA